MFFHGKRELIKIVCDQNQDPTIDIHNHDQEDINEEDIYNVFV